MPLPAPLLRQKSNVCKNDFGHVLVMAGSPRMLGAACLTSLAAMRSGAGLVTAAIPIGLQLTLQKKLSSVVMSLPVAQTRGMTFSLKAARDLLATASRFTSAAIGPGLTRDSSTQNFARRMIVEYPLPMVVDADAINALQGHVKLLLKAKALRILTPHAGEMSRLLKHHPGVTQKDRIKTAEDFARTYHVVLVLKGNKTVVASPDGRSYINTTGNPGMATAGSGDVLTGMIAALLAQGLSGFDAALWGVKLHGQAADNVIHKRLPASLMANDIIDAILLRKGNHARFS
ncbi:MAG: NAD(P)H-hydrate dehydratase [Candidatus Omnitrophota bacterium]